MFRFHVCMFLACLCLSTATAQEVRVRVATDQPPHYVDAGAIVQFTVNGLESDPPPKCELVESSDDLRVDLIGMVPEVSVQQFIQGNQVRVVESATFTIQLRVTPDKAGDYSVGPFLITQGKIKERVDAVDLSFQAVPVSDDMKVKLILPQTVYPDQRVPVKIEWWYAGDFENLRKLNIDSELFDKFRYTTDPQPPGRGSRMPIRTEQGEIVLAATTRQVSQDGKTFTVLQAERTMVPDRPGKFEIAPAVATIELVTQWQRSRGLGSIFGSSREPAKVERYRANGEPISFRVKPFPASGRPESFTGTVGNGFSLDVSADRTVVRTGDPIRLTIRLRGDGNINTASLPALSADGGLDPQQFRLPDGDVAGNYSDGVKEFTVSVRVQDENINEIPAIAFSWFDTETETYQTTRSDPVALRVDPTAVVGADSVVSRLTQSRDVQEDSAAGSSPAAATDTLTGADLSIVSDPKKLWALRSGLLGRTSTQAAGYGVGVLLILLAYVDRRRRQVDPEVRRAKQLVHHERRRVAGVSKLPAKQAAKEIADALRNVAAQFPESDRTAMMKVMSECDALTFQPDNSQSGPVDADLVRRSLDVIDQLSQQGAS